MKCRFGWSGAVWCWFCVVEAGSKCLGKRCLIVVGVSGGMGVLGWLLCLRGVYLVRSRKLGGKRSCWC